MNQVLHCDTWQHGNTARFAKEFSKHTGKKISRANVHSWLIKSGIPPKFIFLAESISQKHGKKISAKELRPDILIKQ